MIVQTDAGKVAGVLCKGAHVFWGIPYAAPANGNRRFKPPAPPLPWSGIKDCRHVGTIAPQNVGGQGSSTTLVQSEDCLHLNVWTSGSDKELKPVLVFIHGGGFISGSGADSDGSRYVVEDGLVYVSINYRLGVLGFLHLEDILGEEYMTSGNNGMLDIVFALEWVQRNISAFGGDPERVTVSGASAGAKCTASLYVMEAAQGLFCRAIAQSGATQAIRDRSTANVTTLRILEKLGLTEDPGRLLELPFETLIEAQSAIGSGTSRSLHMFGPVADGRIIPLKPLSKLANREKMPPMLIGTNEDESTIFIHNDIELQSPNLATLERFFGRNALTVWAAYLCYTETMSDADAWRTILTEHLYTVGAIQFANALASSGTPVWMYRLRSGGVLGATHGYESSLIHFANSSHPVPVHLINDPHTIPTEQYELARNMRKSWLTYIRHGNPNSDALPVWPTYNNECSTMVLDKVSYVQENMPQPAGIGVHHQVWRILDADD